MTKDLGKGLREELEHRRKNPIPKSQIRTFADEYDAERRKEERYEELKKAKARARYRQKKREKELKKLIEDMYNNMPGILGWIIFSRKPITKDPNGTLAAARKIGLSNYHKVKNQKTTNEFITDIISIMVKNNAHHSEPWNKPFAYTAAILVRSVFTDG